MDKKEFVSLFSDQTNSQKHASGWSTREEFIAAFADPEPAVQQPALTDARKKQQEQKAKHDRDLLAFQYDGLAGLGVVPSQAQTTAKRLQESEQYNQQLTAQSERQNYSDKELFSAYSQPDVKLSDYQIKTAKDLVKAFEAKYPKAQSFDPINGMDQEAAYQYAAMMNDPQYQEYLQLKNKVDDFSAFTTGLAEGTGAAQAINFFGRIGADDEAKAQMDEWKDQRNAVIQAGAAQNPIAYGAGVVGGEIAKQLAVKTLLRATPGVSGGLQRFGSAVNSALDNGTTIGSAAATLFPAGRIADMTGDQVVDTLIDTVPQVLEDLQRMDRQQREGVAEGEEEITGGGIALDAVKNFGANIGYNLLGELPGMIGDARYVPDAIRAQEALDALDEGVLPTARQAEAYNRYAARNGLEGSEDWYKVNMSQRQDPFLAPEMQTDGTITLRSVDSPANDLYIRDTENGVSFGSRAADDAVRQQEQAALDAQKAAEDARQAAQREQVQSALDRMNSADPYTLGQSDMDTVLRAVQNREVTDEIVGKFLSKSNPNWREMRDAYQQRTGIELPYTENGIRNTLRKADLSGAKSDLDLLIENYQNGNLSNEQIRLLRPGSPYRQAFMQETGLVLPTGSGKLRRQLRNGTLQANQLAGTVNDPVYKEYYMPELNAKSASQEIDGTLKTEYNGVNGGVLNESAGETAVSGMVEDPQPVGQGVGAGNGGKGQAAGGNQVLRGFLTPDENLNQAVARTGATPLELTDTTGDPQLFSSALEQARQANPHGLMVSGKSVEELTQPGTVTFMSRDGLAGALVTADGDIEAVFKNPQSSAKGAASSLLLNAINNGGTKLDCYGDDLVNMYNRYGFEPVARVKWNPEYAPDGWTYGPKDVYVMKLTDGVGINEINARIGLSETDGGFHRWTQEELNALPVMDYDDALAYRDSLIKSSPIQTQSDAIPLRADGSASVSAPVRQDIPPSVGAWESDPARYSNMQNTYGTISPGENPSRVVDVPVSTNGSDRVSRFARTAMEAEATPDSMLKNYESYVEQGLFSYKPLTDKAALDTAVRNISQNGYADALQQWQRVVDGYTPVSKESMTLAQLLYAEAAKAGDTDTAMKLAAEIAAEGTNLGQSIQSMRLLKKLTPEGQLYYAQKVVDKLNRDLKAGKTIGVGVSNSARNAFQSGATTLSIPKELADQLLNAKNTKEIAQASEAIFTNISQQLPADWATKWNAWRYLSMLGNPRTHVRNILGNAVFYPARKIKDALAAGLERVAISDVSQRTKAILNLLDDTDNARKAFAKADYDNEMRSILTGGGKQNPENIIKQNQKVFTSRFAQPVEFLRKFNSDLMDAEDNIFLKNAYADSMAGYMKAQGLTEKDMVGEVLEKARTYASGQALKATYRDASALANALNRFTQTNTATRIIGGSLFPFTKTPINVMKRGLEYSPVGIAKGIAEAILSVKDGSKTVAQAIDSISAGLTGTGLIALGGFLGYYDILSGSAPDNKKEKTFSDLTGQQEYSLKVGDGSYTLDWAAPTSLLLFVGAESGKMFKEQDGIDFVQFLDLLSGISDPMINMTMLQGINNTIKAAAYGENAIGELAINAATGYASQAVPTVFGQVARAVDDTRRTTYTESGQPLSGISKTLQKAENKIPGLSMMNQPYVDPWGRTEENAGGNFLGRLAYNMLSPGYYEDNNTTQVDSILNELYQETGESSVLPGYAAKTWTQNGEKHSFTAEEYTRYSQMRGQTAYSILDELAPRFDELGSDQAVYAAEKAYDIANQIAKQEIVGVPLDKTYQTIVDAAENYDGGIAELLFAKAVMYDVEGEKYPNGKTVSGSVKRNKIQALVDAGYSRSEAINIYELLN